MDRSDIAQRFANTYTARGERTAWEHAQDYQDVLAYAAEHPNASAYQIAKQFELPRGRVGPWVNSDTKPDQQRGLEIAEAHDWLNVDLDSDRFRTLAIAVAWIYAGGSISEATYTPKFSIDNIDSRETIATVLETLDVGAELVDRDTTSHGTEIRPASDRSILGRLLVALEAPHGTKSETVTTLPSWLQDAPERTRLAVARTYVSNRGVVYDWGPTRVKIQEKRSQQYLDTLFAFIRSFDLNAKQQGDGTILLSGNATDCLHRIPSV